MNELKIQRAAFLEELTNFVSERQDMSVAEILYTILRSNNFKSSKLSDILNISDKELLDRVEQAIENEKE